MKTITLLGGPNHGEVYDIPDNKTSWITLCGAVYESKLFTRQDRTELKEFFIYNICSDSEAARLVTEFLHSSQENK